jgi:hypothetical protein
MKQLKLYTTVAAIEAACVAFGKRADKLQNEAHKIACSVLAHVGEHSDVRVVTKFIESAGLVSHQRGSRVVRDVRPNRLQGRQGRFRPEPQDAPRRGDGQAVLEVQA